MSKTMTMAEIEAQYPSEWVLIGDVEVDDHFQVLAGTVLWHGKDRDEVDRRAIELRPKCSAIRYTGSFPEDMEFVL